jgi:hypothetical protein
VKKFDPNLGTPVKNRGDWKVRLLVSLIMVFLVVASNAYHELRNASYLAPGGAYQGAWDCEDGQCTLFIKTPNGLMKYPVPPQIQGAMTRFYSV